MLVQEIRNIKSGISELRKFGITLCVVFGLLGALFLWRAKPFYYQMFAVSGFFLFFGLAFPIILKPIHKVWMGIALVLGFIMTGVILSVLFYLVITPIGLLSRLCGKDSLDLKLDKSVKSYWIQKKKIDFEKSNYERQF